MDPEGIRHSVEVSAETLYEAAALGLHALIQDEWVGQLRPRTTVDVEVMPVPSRHQLPVSAIVKWLQAASRSPRERLIKEKTAELVAIGS